MKRLMILVAILSLSGCVTNPENIDSDSFANRYQVSLIAGLHLTKDPAATASEIRSVLDDVKAWYKFNESASVADLKTAVISRIETPDLKFAASKLWDANIQPALDEAVETAGVLVPVSPEQIVVRVNKFIALTEEVVSFY